MDRRMYPRWPKMYSVVVGQGDDIIEGTTFDISQTGMRLILSEQPSDERDLPMTVFLPDGYQDVNAELSWCKAQESGAFLVGVHLISVSAEYLNHTAILKYEEH